MEVMKQESTISVAKPDIRRPPRSVSKPKENKSVMAETASNSVCILIKQEEKQLLARVPIVSFSRSGGGIKAVKKNEKGDSHNAVKFAKMREYFRESIEMIEQLALVAKDMQNESRLKLQKVHLLFRQAEHERKLIEYKIMEKKLDLVSDPVSRAYFVSKQEEIMERMSGESDGCQEFVHLRNKDVGDCGICT